MFMKALCLSLLVGSLVGCRLSPIGETARLHQAVLNQKVNSVKRYIKWGAFVNSRESERGWTPLLYAAELENYQIAEILIDHGADVNMLSSEDKVSPLQRAAAKGDLRMINLLLTHGAHIDHQDNKLRSTPLMWASANSHFQAVKVLLDSGSLVDVRGNRGESALFLAVSAQNVDIVKLLLSFNAIKDRPDIYGITPIYKAKQLGNEELVDLLSNNEL